MVLLITSDNEELSIDKDAIRCSGLLAPFADAEDTGTSSQPVPVQVSSPVMRKVLEYCEHHRGDPIAPAQSGSQSVVNERTNDIGEWDHRFLDVDQELLFEIIMAANYLDIKPLLDAGCKMVTNMIKGKTPEEIRKLFNIVNEFTPKENAQIKKGNEWADDR